jgi:arginyl-tRNA synthetase
LKYFSLGIFVIMKSTIEQLLSHSLQQMRESGAIPSDLSVEVRVDRSKDKAHGDFATNLALLLAKPCAQPPRKLAEQLIAALPENTLIERTDIAGAGFINFFICQTAQTEVVAHVLAEKERFGASQIGGGQSVLLEFVSANPTGPLHVGHGRSAAFGASLANLLTFSGFRVCREYYVNDAGRQMDILAASVWLRYLALAKEPIVFPANGYRGEYVQTIAQDLLVKHGREFVHPFAAVIDSLPNDEPEGGDKELYIDAIIQRAKDLLGADGFKLFHAYALQSVLSDIQHDLSEFGVHYDDWFSERTLEDEGAIQKAVDALNAAGKTYEHEGALWFRATDFGDEKDRVLIRANGQSTYFASDVAYHWNKYHRGFERVIDIFGADHHGYISRITAAVHALGHDANALTILLVQFAILYRAGERVQMSTRSGSFVTLRELREEVGNDAARFFYVMRKPEQHMDFDLDLAKSQSTDNPVYYIQYAHARICSVLRQLQERGMSHDEAVGLSHIAKLQEPHELALMVLISRYPETVEAAAHVCEPHLIAYYLRELATGLHSYYNAVTLLCDHAPLRHARLCLLKSVRQVLCNGMQLLGVSTPESM